MAFDVELIVVEDMAFTYTPPVMSMLRFRENQTGLQFNLGAHLAQSEPITTGIMVGTITGTSISNVTITVGGQSGTYGSTIALMANTDLANIWIQFDTADINTPTESSTINFTTTGGP